MRLLALTTRGLFGGQGGGGTVVEYRPALSATATVHFLTGTGTISTKIGVGLITAINGQVLTSTLTATASIKAINGEATLWQL